MDLKEEDDTVIDDDLRKMARDISRKHTAGSKHGHDKDLNEEEEGEDGNGFMFEDLDEVTTPAVRKMEKLRALPSQVPCIGHWQRWMACAKTDMLWIGLK